MFLVEDALPSRVVGPYKAPAPIADAHSLVAIRDMLMSPVPRGVQYLANGVGASVPSFLSVSVIMANCGHFRFG